MMKITKKWIASVLAIIVLGGFYIYINEPIKHKLIECFYPIPQINTNK